MPNPDSNLLHMAYYKINYITDLIQAHHQRLRVEERTAAATTYTISALTVIGYAAMIKLAPD